VPGKAEQVRRKQMPGNRCRETEPAEKGKLSGKNVRLFRDGALEEHV
jgi:hypothetical protein